MRALIITLLLASYATAEERPVTTITERALAVGQKAYHITDGKAEALVVPSIGRVMQFSRVGGANWLWNAPQVKEVQGSWKNFGGEKVWISPQALWDLHTGHGFSPDEAWESGHEAAVLDNPPRLQTTSPVSKCGVRIVREFSFNEKGQFVIRTTLEKTDEKPLYCGAWTVTQVTPPDAIYLPTSDASVYKNNHYNWSRKPVGNIATLAPDLVRVIPTISGSYKIGVDAPVTAIAAIRDGVAFIQRSDRTKDGDYPDGAQSAGFPVELYDHGDPQRHYLELELLSPMRFLKKDQKLTFEVSWSLRDLPSKDSASESVRRAISALLKGMMEWINEAVAGLQAARRW